MPQALLKNWHDFMRTPDPQALRAILHDECVFLSPVVFTPQKGADATMAYLLAAGQTFKGSGFHYTSELLGENRMVLEFETELDGKYINGVDIIDFDSDGLITRFKVMLRPLQAVNMVQQKMAEMLEELKSA